MRAAAVLCSLTFLGLLAGCDNGPQRAAVSGTVTLNGKPIEEGAISFVPVEGNKGPQVGAIITNGQYSIPKNKGVIVGKNRVELRSIQKLDRKIQDPTQKPGVLTDERGEAFPPEYNEKSTLVRDVLAEDNNFDFKIKTDVK